MRVKTLTAGHNRGPLLAFAVAALFGASSASAQARVVLPAGTVIIVNTTQALESATAKTGQSFETTVADTVGVDEYVVIPAGSRIRGVVTVAKAATRRESGVIEVVFDRLMFPDGSSAGITGKLTSTDSAERRQIESNPNARVVLVGGRGGIGAAIAGAGSGRSANNILSALGGLLSEGRDVSVPAGTQLAVELEQPVTLRVRARISGTEASTIYTATDRILAAQSALARLNYYRGPVNGRMDDATRRALFQFQIDQGLSATGNLDRRTAQALGLNVSSAATVSVLSPEAATTVRRDAQSLVSQVRADLGVSRLGRLDPARSYAQSDLDLWFALAAFADNASTYEEIVRTSGNGDAAVLAGRSLLSSARRVDAAMQSARTTGTVQGAWSNLRQQLTVIDTTPPT